jgi:hypothetical protein
MPSQEEQACPLDVELQDTIAKIKNGIDPSILCTHFNRLRKYILECPHHFHLPNFDLLRWMNEREVLIGVFLPYDSPEQLRESCMVLNILQLYVIGKLNGEEEFVGAILLNKDCLSLLNDYSLSWVRKIQERMYSAGPSQSSHDISPYPFKRIEEEER